MRVRRQTSIGLAVPVGLGLLAVLGLAPGPVAGAAGESGPGDATTSTVSITPGLPAGMARIMVPLTASSSDQTHYGPAQQRQISSGPVPERLQSAGGGAYRFHVDLGSDPAGRAYHLLVEPREDLKVLSQHGGSAPIPLSALVLRESGPAAPRELETVTSGILMPGQHTEIPFRVPLSVPVGSNALREFGGALGFSLNPHSDGRYAGNSSFRTRLSVSGAAFLERAKIEVKMNTVAEIPPGREQQVSVSLEPLDPHVPARQASGKLSDTLTLGGMRLAVEEVAADLSAIRFAVVHGDVEQTIVRQEEAVSALPALAQVELFDRRMLSSSDLLSSAAESGWLVLVFGEFRQEETGGERGMVIVRPGQPTSVLSMAPQAVLQILVQGTGTGRPPATAFVVRGIDLSLLYSDYLNGRPDFLVLSDYADPMRVQFRSPTPYGGGYYPPGPHSASRSTLRQILGLPDDRVSVVLFDAAGKAHYVKPDAGENLQGALLEAVEAMKKGGQ